MGFTRSTLTPSQRAYLDADEAAGRVWDYLAAHHVGSANALPRDDAPAKFNLNDRKVRDVVSALGTAGFPVTANPDGGYFVAVTAAELEPSCAILEKRAETEGARAKGLREALLIAARVAEAVANLKAAFTEEK